ncbi:MAG: hypothetical protein LWX56_09435 [Ignavibacteria bacterium]|nr:hypothetical protein [Ignavibacteria bacterium]
MQELSPEQIEFTYALERAKQLAAEGKMLHAQQLYFRLAQNYPEQESAVIGLVGLYDSQGNETSARETIYSAIEKAPENIQLRLFAGHYFFKKHLWQETIDVLGVVVPEQEPLGAFFTGYAYFMLKEYILAKRYYIIYLEKRRSAEFVQDAYVYLCKICIHLGEFKEALEYVKLAEEFFSAHFELRLLYAVVYFYLEMYTNAIVEIEKAITLNPSEPSLYEWGAKIAMQCQRYDQAERYLRFMQDMVEELPVELISMLGLACMYNKKIAEARELFAKSLSLQPDEPGALDGLNKINTEFYVYERK